MEGNKINYYSNFRTDVYKIISDLPVNKVLEIGGGHFNLLSKLKESRNIDAWGIDVVDLAAEDITFIHGSFEDDKILEKFSDNKFDLIIANDVIEHMIDTEKVFSMLNYLLKENGKLVISLPNIRNVQFLYQVFIKGSFPRHEEGIFDKTHLRWFCIEDVKDFLERYNFDLIKIHQNGRMIPNIFRSMTLFQFLSSQIVYLAEKK